MTVDKVKPKKALGQHFMTDISVDGRNAYTLSVYVGVRVFEGGPGRGVLTRFLLDGGHDLTVVELDRESVEYLQANFPQLHGRIVEADFLRLDLAELTRGREFCVIGNYPYNISSQIFFRILDYKDMVPCCSGMLQREVAERLAAPEGTKARGILSVLLQLWYRVDYLFTVSENVFNPPPKVKSGVIKLVRNDRRLLPCSEQLLKSVVKVTFGQRRKTIRNSIRAVCPDFPAGHPLAQMRPEQLSVEQFIELTLEVERVRAQA